jgi:hypothetical protein
MNNKPKMNEGKMGRTEQLGTVDPMQSVVEVGIWIGLTADK